MSMVAPRQLRQLLLGSGTGGRRSWYAEGTDSRNTIGNWNHQEQFNMTTCASFGNCWIHGWGGSPRTYELTLNGIPTHTEVRYTCYIHMVDSWDNEYNNVRMWNNGQSQINYVEFRKTWNNPYLDSVGQYNGGTVSFVANQPYSYEPWNGNNQPTNGYAVIDTNWQSHSNSNIRIFHRTDLDQGAGDEAYYISHATLWIG